MSTEPGPVAAAGAEPFEYALIRVVPRVESSCTHSGTASWAARSS